ncbi:MAG: CpaD family pilus assembly protein [Pseudomonadota bacterium]
MFTLKNDSAASDGRVMSAVSKIALVAAAVVALAGCREGFEKSSTVRAWTVADHAQRHPILVTKKPSTIKLAVARESYGLSPNQRATLISFLTHYHAQNAGNSRIRIQAPSGAPNEVAAMRVVDDVKTVAEHEGFDASNIVVNPYHAEGNHAPPIHVSYLRYVAEGPECGVFTENLGKSDRNLAHPDFGCSNQRNFAANIANPADLLGPRSMTPRDNSRRANVWKKYREGQSSASQRTQDERVNTRSSQ